MAHDPTAAALYSFPVGGRWGNTQNYEFFFTLPAKASHLFCELYQLSFNYCKTKKDNAQHQKP